ncbi:formylglycine-generating enzyme family protein [Fodinibius sediminis]|uniref:Formylglycine-generating enzyme, required for sulfatase activity, contains SUMF1/FGE domain n=1 Tax=Fodinibius sediminis TaxID=1214077 RepID=A0A521BKF0_9BACT|nr:formylglycine-generating enzyme family protein [Fodinibius sediminis]SMO47555.1 Formylglycine-generating enzyme, required for sulfatase activity, contains SUMF1/FGE domain [Fodinibius sediminis]
MSNAYVSKRVLKVSAVLKYRFFLLYILFTAGFGANASAQTDSMAFIEGGHFMPFYHTSDDSVAVASFYLDKHPVTNGEFLAFVKVNPQWRRSQVKSIFAEPGYLNHWSGDLDLGPRAEQIKDSPVTNVSWFAARAYAQWKGKRLPTLHEWEYAASASRDQPLAGRNKGFVQQILDWYSRPSPTILPAVGQQTPNYYGVYDLHGLIWEWVQDFNTVFISGESRADQGELKQFYCAAGSSAASDIDKENYAAFLRYAFRGSLEADFSVGNLGFRCARDKQ